MKCFPKSSGLWPKKRMLEFVPLYISDASEEEDEDARATRRGRRRDDDEEEEEDLSDADDPGIVGSAAWVREEHQRRTRAEAIQSFLAANSSLRPRPKNGPRLIQHTTHNKKNKNKKDFMGSTRVLAWGALLLWAAFAVMVSEQKRAVLFGTNYPVEYSALIQGDGFEYEGYIGDNCEYLSSTSADVVLYPGEDFTLSECALEALQSVTQRGVHVVITEWMMRLNNARLEALSPVLYDKDYAATSASTEIFTNLSHPLLTDLPASWALPGGRSKVVLNEDSEGVAFMHWTDFTTEVPTIAYRQHDSGSVWIHINSDFLYSTSEASPQLTPLQSQVLLNALNFAASLPPKHGTDGDGYESMEEDSEEDGSGGVSSLTSLLWWIV